MIATTSWSNSTRRGFLTLVDLPERTTRTINLADGAYSHATALHPSGKWLAVATQQVPERNGRRDIPPEDLAQPKIECVDLATGKIIETIVMPQCLLHAIEFSPDGNTLASSGLGSVLLWDVRTPIGRSTAFSDAP